MGAQITNTTASVEITHLQKNSRNVQRVNRSNCRCEVHPIEPMGRITHVRQSMRRTNRKIHGQTCWIILTALLMGSLVTPCFGETNLTVIKSFGYAEESAYAPEGGLIEGSDGMLYG